MTPAVGGGGGGGGVEKSDFSVGGPSVPLGAVASASPSSAASSSAASCVGVWAVLVVIFSLGWVVLRIEYLFAFSSLVRYGCAEAFV